VIRLGVAGHLGYAGVRDVIATLKRLAPQLGIELSWEEELRGLGGPDAKAITPSTIDTVLTLGGDGTFLRASRLVDENPVPILGINLGRLGFLTACPVKDLESALVRLSKGEYSVEERMTLNATLMGEDGAVKSTWRALNDVVLHKGGFARVITLLVEANGEMVATYSADGVVISSPTGSTAYNLSAGGPVVFPTLETIVVTPVSAHTLALRALVLPPTTEVRVRAEDGPGAILVTVDGQVGANFSTGETLVVRRSSRPVSVVRFPDSSFFATMRQKLHWGGLPDRDERH
jgi:NAD+ kinase